MKKEESEEEDDDIEDEEDEDEDFDEDEDEGASDSKKKSVKSCVRLGHPIVRQNILKENWPVTLQKNGSTGAKGGANSAKGGNNAKSFPDKDGKFELYLFKNDLVKDFREDPKLCMWRRDGSSLLQKYIKVKNEENQVDVFFTASSVVSTHTL